MTKLILIQALAVILVGGATLVMKVPPHADPKPRCYFEPGPEPTCPECQVFDTHLCKCMKIPACKP